MISQLLDYPIPFGFKEHRFEKSWKLRKLDKKWETLQLRETFTKGQIFPYRVEFLNSPSKGEMEIGELNIHHGPFLSANGIVSDKTDSFREIKYFYGAYVLSFRWIRPRKLQFKKTNSELQLVLICDIKPWIKPLWSLGLGVFWRLFPIFI